MKIRKLNNQGSTLLTVIIIIAFIGILGSMMLSVTMTNLQMKMIERKSKENFYTCESTLDEMRTRLHEITVEKIREVYEDDILMNMSTYIALTDEELKTELRNKVSLGLVKDELGNTMGINDIDLLAGIPVGGKDNLISLEFEPYLTPLPIEGYIVRNIDISESSISIMPQEGIAFSNILVSMTVNDFESRIRTDIIVELPEFLFDDGLQTIIYRMEQPYKDYALIADGRIESDQFFGSNHINGSVYAGRGITVSSQMTDNHSLVINGGNIVTRGDISVEDTGRLDIDGTYKLDEEGNSVPIPATIWANNIKTDTTLPISSSFTLPTTIEIDGICLVKDDLTLNGSFSEVSIRGAYVGYTGTRSSLGSSIIVNGNESSLDLSGLDSLILAGRAHVSVDDNKGGLTNTTDIMTGESVAIKSNQKAYLIPGRFINGPIREIRRNPITSSDITGNNIPEVNFEELDPALDINYLSYVDPVRPFMIASRQTIEGDTATVLYYYYLGFESGKLADDYLREYISKDEFALDKTEPFKIQELILPNPDEKEVIAAGNLMSYKADTLPKVGFIDGISSRYSPDPTADININHEISSINLDNPVFMGNELKASDTVGGLESLYNKISSLLSLESDRIYIKDDNVVKSTIISDSTTYLYQWRSLNQDKYDWIDYFYCYNSDYPHDEIQTDAKIITVNGDAYINNDFIGLMVVNGDVNISDNVSIDGMILAIDSDTRDSVDVGNIYLGNNVDVTGRLAAMGDIILGTNNTFTASDQTLEQLFIDQSEVLIYIFKNLEKSILYTRTDPADNLVDLSTMIYYRNWRRE